MLDRKPEFITSLRNCAIKEQEQLWFQQSYRRLWQYLTGML